MAKIVGIKLRSQFESLKRLKWEDVEVHQDNEKIRNKALQMGINIIIYALTR